MSNCYAPLQRLLESGVAEEVFTAAVALVGLKGELLWEGAAGRISRDPEAATATPATLFDLASLTKPLATALALMVLADQGEVSLTTPLGALLPYDWLPPDKHALSLGSLLIHRSGLPAWRPFYAEVLAAPGLARPTLLERLAAATPLEHPPDTVTVYSDLGFMLLKAVVEHVSGQKLDHFCREEIYQPLGLNILGFIPLPKPAQVLTAENQKPKTENRVYSDCQKFFPFIPLSPLGERVRVRGVIRKNFWQAVYAATETGLIPGRPDAGQVHDENAWAAGGVAGHAGLFGTGREVFVLAACLYRAYGGEQAGPLTPDVVQRFFTVPPGADRAYGFDIPSGDPGQRAAGRFFSSNSIGHLGFTGTSFWLDLATGQMVVLLTNRVHLGRNDKTKIQAFRPRFHEAASSALSAI